MSNAEEFMVIKPSDWDDLQLRLNASEARNADAISLLRDVAKSPWLYDVLGSVREFLAKSAPATDEQVKP